MTYNKITILNLDSSLMDVMIKASIGMVFLICLAGILSMKKHKILKELCKSKLNIKQT